MNYYERHIGDYLKDTAHLSLIQHGIYARLLDVYYTREGPLQEADALRLIGARSKDERAAAIEVLAEFFELVDGAWTQGRCESEIARYRDKQEKARRSADARWSESGRNANALRKADAKRMRTHSERNADGMHRAPVPSLHTPDTDTSEPNGSGAAAPSELTKAELWAAGKSLLAAQGMPQAQCGSFVGKLVKDHGEGAVVDAVRAAIVARPADAAEWLVGACRKRGTTNGKHAGFSTKDYREGVTSDGHL